MKNILGDELAEFLPAALTSLIVIVGIVTIIIKSF